MALAWITSYFSSPEPKRNIVLIGNTGNGKSSAGNMIIRKDAFITKASANSITTECQRGENIFDKKKITVIDTPDFFDIEDEKEEKMKSEVIKALIECAEGVHAFVIVLKVGRFTTNEKKMVQQLLNTLTEDVLKHTLILFTFGEQLEGQNIKEFVKTNSQLKELVDKCGGRCHVIDKYWKRQTKKNQVKKILKTIDKMVKKYNCYSNDLLQEVEKQIQEQINAGLHDKESKDKFLESFLRLAARIATRTLVGAFLGVRDAVVSEIISMLSVNLQSLTERTLGPAVAPGARRVTEGAFEGAVRGFVSGLNEKDVDSGPDTTSKAATTSFENAISLMNDAQTKIESAKNILEAATNMLKKK